MEEEKILSYSLHLSNDKNKTKKARRSAKILKTELLLYLIMQFKMQIMRLVLFKIIKITIKMLILKDKCVKIVSN
ncbi:MAG: hypothetical protein NC483_01545 [Ruminococcus sp.]|nr:hypothetical protein [Ruminococcus sp.]